MADQESLAEVDDRVSERSGRSKASKKSVRSVLESVKEEGSKPDWDRSVKGESQHGTLEDRLASKLADQVLEQNTNLKGVHSKQSIRRILEKEAKRQLGEGGVYKGPVVSTIKEKERQEGPSASNLPYLHKNPAI